jgi:hypothetical protein
VDVAACDDPHVIAGVLLQLLRDRDPPALDFNRVNACERGCWWAVCVCFVVCRQWCVVVAVPKDGMGPASTIVPSLRGLFITASEEDIIVCNKLCSVISKVSTGCCLSPFAVLVSRGCVVHAVVSRPVFPVKQHVRGSR